MTNHFPLGYHKDITPKSKTSIFDFVEPQQMYSVSFPKELSIPSRCYVIHELNDALALSGMPVLVDFSSPNEETIQEQMDALPFGWKGVTSKEDGLPYQGTLMKRIMAFLWKEYKYKLPPDVIGRIGNIIGKDVSCGSAMHLQFDPIACYRDGQFGDSGSCYWGGRKGARVAIRNEGGSFVLFYSDSDAHLEDGRVEDGKGLGRCWVIPVNHYAGESVPLFLLCNVYSGSPQITKYSAIRAVSSVMGMTYKHVPSVQWNEPLWINGSCGFLIGHDVEVVNRVASKGFHVAVSGLYSNYNSRDPELVLGHKYTCHNCGSVVGENEYDSEWGWCTNCLDNETSWCDRCDSRCRSDEITTVANGHSYCLDCLTYLDYVSCAECGEYYKEDDMYWISDRQESVCSDCYDSSDYHVCDDCGNYIEDAVTNENGTFCNDCISRHEETEEVEDDANTN